MSVTVLASKVRAASGFLLRSEAGSKNTKLRSDIQGLRAFAVVVVILDHLLHWPRGGFIGVDIFFVISGFVITESLLREWQRTGTISFRSFYKRRVKRILPASTLVLFVTVAASFVALNQSRFISISWDAVFALIFSGNWRFAIVGTDYFQASGPVSPLQHYWSLAVEEQFYFVWPWLMLLVFTLANRRSLGGRSARWVVGVVITVICLASFTWAIYETTNMPILAYFSTMSRTWELGVGALIGVISPLLTRLPGWLRPILAWVGVAGMVSALFVIDSGARFPAPWAALPVMAAAIFIVAGTGTNSHRLLSPFTNRVSGYIGDISYSLYLWHFPVIIIAGALMEESPLYYLIAGIGGLAIAIYSYHLVEDPIRKSDWLVGGRRNRPRRTSESYKVTALSFLALITIPVVAAAWTPPPTQPTVAVPANVIVDSGAAMPGALPLQSSLQKEIISSLSATEWPTLTPSLEEVIGGPQTPEEIGMCGRGLQLDEETCSWGNPNASRTLVTIGNSTSMAYVAALRSAIGTTGEWRIVSYGMFGCPVGNAESLSELKVMPEGCLARSSQAVEAINRIKPDVVVASGVYESADEVLSQVVVPVKWIFLPGPPIDKDVAKCYTKLNSPVACVSAVPERWASTEKALAGSMNGAIYIDSTPWFCYQRSCPSFVGTTPTKLDATHLTAAYAEKLGPVIRETFVNLGIFDGPR